MIQTGRVHIQVHVIATKNRISSHVLSNNGLRLHSMPSTLLSLVLVVNSDRFHKFYGVTCMHSYSSHPFLWALLGGIYRNTFLCTVYNFFPRRLRPKFKNSKNDPNRSSTHSGLCTVVIATCTSQPVEQKSPKSAPPGFQEFHAFLTSYVFIDRLVPRPNCCCICLASFPGPAQLSTASSTVNVRGPGIFSHVSDVRIERMVERV